MERLSPRIFQLILVSLFILNHIDSTAQNYVPEKYMRKEQILTSVRIASTAILPDKWEKEINWNRIEPMIRKAALEGGAKVVLTPEGILEGYIIEDSNNIKDKIEKTKIIERIRNVAEPMNGPFIQKACNLAD